MPAPLHRNALALPIAGALAIVISVLFATRGAAAQEATGTITGRVLWGACIRAIPLPASPDGAFATPAVPDSSDGQAAPGRRQVPASGLPAGAVIVALQNTSIGARTDESGRFTLSDVPVGQYFTVAAGPVANSLTAIAERPNVIVSAGQSFDVGTLSLGGQSAGLTCRFQPGAAGAGTDAPPDETATP
jgi:hypothetical protein